MLSWQFCRGEYVALFGGQGLGTDRKIMAKIGTVNSSDPGKVDDKIQNPDLHAVQNVHTYYKNWVTKS